MQVYFLPVSVPMSMGWRRGVSLKNMGGAQSNLSAIHLQDVLEIDSRACTKLGLELCSGSIMRSYGVELMYPLVY